MRSYFLVTGKNSRFFLEWVFSEVSIAPVQRLLAPLAEIGCLRILSRLPHNTE
jgi:hypothetical protein